MKELLFYGREVELERLRALQKKSSASLVVIKGRRRIGKSRLISEFSKGLRCYNFTGLPPTKETTAKMQMEYFVEQMEKYFPLRGIKAENWWDIFWNLAQFTKTDEVIVVLDEINWMGSCDPTFLGKLKSSWDLHFKNNPNFILILSGSMSTWIDKNILSSTGFMGRTSLELTLEELPLKICNLFWKNKKDYISSYEKFKILSVTGGVPRYLEEINPDLNAEENIHSLAFRKGGILTEEFDRIFSDLFSSRSERYKLIVQKLVDGCATLDEITKSLGLEKGGTVSEYLEDLVETGYINKDLTINMKTGKVSNLCKFRLKDNYLRFYLKYVEPLQNQIQKNRIIYPPAWQTIMGLQFENLVMNNFQKIIDLLKIDSQDVIFDAPYFQRKSKIQAGCQIDYMLLTKHETVFIFEIKFSKEKIGLSVVEEMKEKIKKLSRPKYLSIRSVLIHVNGVTDQVEESGFFFKIIGFDQFLV